MYKLYLSPSLYDPTCAPVPAHLRQLPHLPLCNAAIHTGVTGAIMWHTGRSLKKTCPLSQLHPSVVLISRDQQQRKVFATAMNFKSSLADSMRIKTNKRMRLKLGKGKKTTPPPSGYVLSELGNIINCQTKKRKHKCLSFFFPMCLQGCGMLKAPIFSHYSLYCLVCRWTPLPRQKIFRECGLKHTVLWSRTDTYFAFQWHSHSPDQGFVLPLNTSSGLSFLFSPSHSVKATK